MGYLDSFIFLNPNTDKPYMPDSKRIWKKAVKSVRADITLYQAARYSVASMAGTSGVSIPIIKKVLGYIDIHTTQKYAHFDVLAHSHAFEAQKEKGQQNAFGF